MYFLPEDVTKPNKAISLLHINAQSARNKSDQLAVFLQQFNFQFDVIMLSETWYHDEADMFILPNYQHFFSIDAIGVGEVYLSK